MKLSKIQNSQKDWDFECCSSFGFFNFSQFTKEMENKNLCILA